MPSDYVDEQFDAAVTRMAVLEGDTMNLNKLGVVIAHGMCVCVSLSSEQRPTPTAVRSFLKGLHQLLFDLF
jgi:hypothetical protein